MHLVVLALAETWSWSQPFPQKKNKLICLRQQVWDETEEFLLDSTSMCRV